MEVDKLMKMKYEVMKYKELQKVAKKAGVKANLPKAELVQALLENSSESVKDAGEEELVPLEESKLDTTFELVNETEQNVLNETFEKEAEVLSQTFEKEQDLTNDDQDSTLETLDESKDSSRFVEFMEKDEEINFKSSSRRTRSLEKPVTHSQAVKKVVGRKSVGRKSIGTKQRPSDYLSVKNKTPLRKTTKTPGSIQKKAESQIPRFVKFAQKSKLAKGKVPDFAKMHEKNFQKMESLDTYIEKKKKLTDTITKQLDRAKALSVQHNSLVKQMKSKTPRNTDPKFVPAVTTTAKMNLNFGASTVNQNKQTFNFGSSTSKPAEPFKFSAKPVAAAPKVVPRQRQDLKSSTMSKPSTNTQKIIKPARKSLVNPTPSKPLLNITNNAANKSINLTNRSMTGTPSKKFDLAASLAKPLGYKPHTGKLKPYEKKKKEVMNKLGSSTQAETKQRQMEVIKGVRLNKRAELLMMRRKMSS
eukprot:GFUD01031497.1.p1 GENE.GFUD01031497.1~~GFUD01031497.1.p1  ORF type:complete len:474 (+),score=187.40 GFUD01031497.1:91-1512(+)